MSKDTTDESFGARLYSFGLVTDVQGGDKPDYKFRYFRYVWSLMRLRGSDVAGLSANEGGKVQLFELTICVPVFGRIMSSDAPGKLEKCLKEWNKDETVEFAIQLGDIIDGNENEELTEKDMDEALRALGVFERPMYHVIGNHCLRLWGGRQRVMERLKMETTQSWYRIETPSSVANESGHVFLVLDGTDISLNKWDVEDPKHKMAEEWLAQHPVEDFPNAMSWNGTFSSEQLDWLRNELARAREAKAKVFIFCHYPILADHLVMEISLLWNASDVVSLLDSYSDIVVGWFCGHYHRGGSQIPGTSASNNRTWAHIALEAILTAPQQSFATVDVHEAGVILKGTGSCSSHRWKFPTP